MRPIIYTALASSLTLCNLCAQAPPAPAAANPVQFAAPVPGDLQGKRLMVLFFDTAGMPAADQLRTQQAALKFIHTQMAAADMVAIMNYTGGINILQDFSNNRETLAGVINTMTFGGAAGSAESTLPARKLATLQSAANMLGALPDKKAVMYFTSGVPVANTDTQAQLNATVNAARLNNVAFYPIDASGLAAPLPGATN